MVTFTFTRPDDAHVHLRDGAMLQTVVKHTASQFARAIIMPNLLPPVTTIEEALAYRQRILDALLPYTHFEPFMTLYLTETTKMEEIRRITEEPHVLGFKLYPAGATTHSDAGIKRCEDFYPILERMEHYNVPLLVHAEVTDVEVDIFDREAVFIDRHLSKIVTHFPALRVVLEHITTSEGIAFVQESGPSVAGTLTAHHLLYNRNALFTGGIRPHMYCLPLLKREHHRLALLKAATSKNPKFFLGTDSAPHFQYRKESACGCAGCYTAYNAIALYTEAFEAVGALDALEAFSSMHAATFYQLPPNQSTITLEKVSSQIPLHFESGENILIPFKAGEQVGWRTTLPLAPD